MDIEKQLQKTLSADEFLCTLIKNPELAVCIKNRFHLLEILV
jgi:hypothetical protein